MAGGVFLGNVLLNDFLSKFMIQAVDRSCQSHMTLRGQKSRDLVLSLPSQFGPPDKGKKLGQEQAEGYRASAPRASDVQGGTHAEDGWLAASLRQPMQMLAPAWLRERVAKEHRRVAEIGKADSSQ